jgi:hypothetical protein
MARTGVLVAILVVVVGMALYERLYALPASEKAHAEIDEAAGQRLLSSEPPLTADEIQHLVGKQPSETVSDDESYMEKYVWRRGLPWRTFYMWVVYTPNKRYQMHFSNEDPMAIADVEPIPEWDDHGLEAPPAVDIPGSPPPGIPIGPDNGDDPDSDDSDSDDPESDDPESDDSAAEDDPSADEVDPDNK